MFCHTGLGHYGHHPDPGEVDLPPETQPTPPSATLVGTTITHLRDPDHHSTGNIKLAHATRTALLELASDDCHQGTRQKPVAAKSSERDTKRERQQ